MDETDYLKEAVKAESGMNLYFFVAIVFITHVIDVRRISGTSDWDWMNEMNKDCNFESCKSKC